MKNRVINIQLTYLFVMVLSLLFNVNMLGQGNNNEVGIDEKLGEYLPLDLKFVTADNDTLPLKSIVDKPFIIDIVYYNCPGICHPLLSELVWAIDRIEMEPGKDFQVITVSFDPTEDHELAAKWKRNYLGSMKRKMPANSWYFLTGDSVNIKKLTSAIGFNYKPEEGTFLHAGAITAIAPDGKISRYIYGSTFNPFDLKMALIDAQNEEVRPTSAKLLQFCFTYDPEGRKYTLNITRVFGSIMMVGVLIFVGILIFKKRKVNKYERG